MKMKSLQDLRVMFSKVDYQKGDAQLQEARLK